jgi:hypothetical protein
LTTKNSTFTGLELQFVAWTTDFLQEVSQSPVSHGASCLINLIEPAYPFCSIAPKETENGRAFKELDSSMTPVAQPWNVRRAWMPQWLIESQRSDRIGPGKELLARIEYPQEEPRRPVLTIGISSTRTSTCTSTRNHAFRNTL